MFFEIQFHSMLNSSSEIDWDEKSLACLWYWMKWKIYLELYKSVLQILLIFMINVWLFDLHFDMCDDIWINDAWNKSACFYNKHFESLQSATILIFDECFKSKKLKLNFKNVCEYKKRDNARRIQYIIITKLVEVSEDNLMILKTKNS